MIRRLAVLLVLVCAATVLLTPVSASGSVVVPVVSEPFDTYDASLWDPHFYLWTGSSYSRSTGTTTLANGAISLRPTQARGTSVLETRRSIVTTLPAHVSFRARYQGTGFREADVQLAPAATTDAFGMPAPLMIWKLGNVGYTSSRNPYLDVVERDGSVHSATQPGAATVIPSGTWLHGDLYLYPNRATVSFNGVTHTSHADIASMVSPDGLRVLLDTVDDYSRQGLDVDEVVVEEGIITPAVPTAAADEFLARQETPLTVDAPGLLLNDTASDGGTMTAALETPPLHGVVDVRSEGGFTYTPAPGFHGVDSFVYRASRDESHFDTATVTLHVLQRMETIVHDRFDSLDDSKWLTYFYSESGELRASTGSTGISGGMLTLRPSAAGGVSALESADPVVTSLPAHVRFVVRFAGPGYRKCDLHLAQFPAYTVFPDYPDGWHWIAGQTIRFKMGQTHYTNEDPTLIIGEGIDPVVTSAPAAAPIPRDVPLICDLWLYADHVEATFNGVTLSLDADVAGRLEAAGGLHLFLDTYNDSGRNGMDVDEVLIEQVMPPAGHIRGEVRNAAGQPLPGVLVSGWREPTSEWGSVQLATQTITGADGSYDLTASVPGWYAVSYDDPSGVYRDQSFPACGLPLEWASALPIEEGDTVSGIDATLTATSWLKANRAVRISGSSRYETALAISRANFEHADTVVLATGAGFADACAAAPLCGAYRAPLLLTSRASLPSGVIPELRRLGAKNVIVVGSRSVVDDGVLQALNRAGFTTDRIAGGDRYATAAEIVRHLLDEGFELQEEPFVVRGDAFPDALAVSPFAYAQLRPVLLVRPDSVPSPTAAIFTELEADTVFIVGSEKAVGTPVLDTFAGLTGDGGVFYARIFGADRFATSEELVKVWEWPYDNLGIATGLDFPDALTGGIACGENWGGLLLSRPGGLSAAATGIIAQNRLYLWPIQVYGARNVISDAVVSQSGFAAGSSFLEFEGAYGPLGIRAASVRPSASDSAGVPRNGVDPSLRLLRAVAPK